MSIVNTCISMASRVFGIFLPAKSPYYAVIVSGTILLLVACQKISEAHWLFIVAPIYLVLIFALSFYIEDTATFTEIQNEVQLRFANGFGISITLLILVIIPSIIEQDNFSFWLNYIACIVQVLVFVFFAWKLNHTGDESCGLNFLPFALITITLLIGASYAITEYVSALSSHNLNLSQVAYRYAVVAIGLYFLWIYCVVLWAKGLISFIHRVRKGEDINTVRRGLILGIFSVIGLVFIKNWHWNQLSGSKDKNTVPAQGLNQFVDSGTFVVTENCIKCKYTDCVDVCPVDAFREGPDRLVIDPHECIECALCEPECPVHAIYSDEVPVDQSHFIELNATLAKKWPPITKVHAPLETCEN